MALLSTPFSCARPEVVGKEFLELHCGLAADPARYSLICFGPALNLEQIPVMFEHSRRGAGSSCILAA
jgi:hypothetical protein